VIEVVLLGTGGMMPLPGRWLASAMLRSQGRAVLIDCGEGTQVAIRQYGFGFRAIETILLTHYHADHTAGLPGVLLAIAFAERTEPVTIVGPVGLSQVLQAVVTLAGPLPFPLEARELADGTAFPAGPFLGRALAGDHRVPCLAYRLDLPRAPRFLPERAQALGVPVEQWRVLQEGEPVVVGEQVVWPTAVLGPPRPGLSVGYLTDSRPTAQMPAFFADVDLLICEATFADPAQAERARQRKHLLFREAAALARASRARRLWLTHFSPALTDPASWQHEAEQEYPAVVVGTDGLQTVLRFAEEAQADAPGRESLPG
jgi:ribonuclease Z